MENLKVYHKDVLNIKGDKISFNEIACYTENDCYCIRISLFLKLYYYGGEKRKTYTKSFKNKDNANDYFKKICEGYKRVK